ncbi:MAG: hypothetical protein ACOCV2_04325 [Persicimonas sp.]
MENLRSARRTETTPRRLYEQSKRGDSWNPARLDFSVDRADWNRLDGEQRLPLLAAAVLAANQARVQWHNSSTLLMAIERRGPLEESLCYASVVHEKARRIEFFELLLGDVIPVVGDPERFFQTHHRHFYTSRLPEVIDRLRVDLQESDLIEALTLDGPLAEGVLHRATSYLFRHTLEKLDVLPTTQQGLSRLEQATDRHLDLATFLIGEILDESPELWETVDETMQSSFEPAVGMVREFYDRYSNIPVPRAEVVTYAVEQFSQRYEQLELSRTNRLDALEAASSFDDTPIPS